jgi:hypothetical protein
MIEADRLVLIEDRRAPTRARVHVREQREVIAVLPEYELPSWERHRIIGIFKEPGLYGGMTTFVRVKTGRLEWVPVVREGNAFSTFMVEDPDGTRTAYVWVELDGEKGKVVRRVKVSLAPVEPVRKGAS